MLTFLNRLARYFTNTVFSSQNKYTLTISRLKHSGRELLCEISDNTNFNPYTVSSSDIFSNDKILSKINPRDLIKLKEKHDAIHTMRNVYLTETTKNKYKIVYDGYAFLMSGKDICNDINLLKSMRFEDAFRIIHETAYISAIKSYKKSSVFENKKRMKENTNNVVAIKWPIRMS